MVGLFVWYFCGFFFDANCFHAFCRDDEMDGEWEAPLIGEFFSLHCLRLLQSKTLLSSGLYVNLLACVRVISWY